MTLWIGVGLVALVVGVGYLLVASYVTRQGWKD